MNDDIRVRKKLRLDHEGPFLYTFGISFLFYLKILTFFSAGIKKAGRRATIHVFMFHNNSPLISSVDISSNQYIITVFLPSNGYFKGYEIRHFKTQHSKTCK